MKTTKNILISQVDRQIIIEFYRESKTKSKLWIWFYTPMVVSQYEIMKAKKEFIKNMIKAIGII